MAEFDLDALVNYVVAHCPDTYTVQVFNKPDGSKEYWFSGADEHIVITRRPQK